MPPHWLLYIAVASADQATARAKTLGATILAEPFDVMEIGRMAVLRDPTRAEFAVWEGRLHKGLGVADEPGAFCWGDLATRDAGQAAAFYTGLFGWGAKPDKKHEYTEWTHGGRSIGGMLPMDAEWGDVPPHWTIYFQVADCDAAAERAKALGGRLVMAPRDIPGVGRVCSIGDPQGATFSIIKLTGLGH